MLSSLLPTHNVDGLYGHLLSVADEEGSVRLLDTRKPATRALCKGEQICFLSFFDSQFLGLRVHTIELALSEFCAIERSMGYHVTIDRGVQ